MTTPNQGAGTTAVDAVLGTLERFAADLQRRTDQAESRAAEAETRLDQERQGRRDAEDRATAAEETARQALRRAEAAEAAVRESLARMHRELLEGIREVMGAVQAAAAARPARPEPRPRAEDSPEPPTLRAERDLAHIANPAAGRIAANDQPTPRRWEREERGYAWVEDEPGPPWWRRLFGRHY